MRDEHQAYDPWGVGEALDMGLRMYTHAKRATGRTTMLLDSLKDRDLVVAATEREARRIAQMAHARGLEGVIGMGYEPKPDRNPIAGLMDRLHGSKRRVVFDHTFFEAMYFWMIRDVQSGLAHAVNHQNRKHNDEINKGIVEALGADMSIVGGPNDR